MPTLRSLLGLGSNAAAKKRAAAAAGQSTRPATPKPQGRASPAAPVRGNKAPVTDKDQQVSASRCDPIEGGRAASPQLSFWFESLNANSLKPLLPQSQDPLKNIAVASIKAATALLDTLSPLGSLPPPRLPSPLPQQRREEQPQQHAPTDPTLAALSAAIEAADSRPSRPLDERLDAAAPALDVLRARWPSGDPRLAAIEAALDEAASAGGSVDEDDSSSAAAAAAAALEGALAAVAEAARSEVELLAAEAGQAVAAVADSVAEEAAAAVAELEAELSGVADVAAAAPDEEEQELIVAAAVVEEEETEAVVVPEPEEEVVAIVEEEAAVEEEEEQEQPVVAAAADPEPTATADNNNNTKTTTATLAPPVVRVRVQCRTSPGESVAIVGSTAALGAWDAAAAVPLTWGEGHVWSGELPLLLGGGAEDEQAQAQAIEFKAVLRRQQEQEVVWENGGNRSLAATPELLQEQEEAAVVVEFEFAR